MISLRLEYFCFDITLNIAFIYTQEGRDAMHKTIQEQFFFVFQNLCTAKRQRYVNDKIFIKMRNNHGL